MQPLSPVPVPPPVVADPTNFVTRYRLNIVVVALTALSVIGATIQAVANAAFLGLTDIQWHWIVLVFAIITALSAAFNPNILQRPTPMRLQLERDLHLANKQGE